MSNLNVGIGLEGIVGGLVVSDISVQAVMAVSTAVGAVGFVIVLSLKNMSYMRH